MRFVFAIPLISLWLMLQAATSNGEKGRCKSRKDYNMECNAFGRYPNID